jgi:hypothetical protein
MRYISIIGCSLIVLLCISTNIFAWSGGKTHPPITKEAIKKKTTLFDEFLETQLNLDGGLDYQPQYTQDGEYQKIIDWITYGSENEDAPIPRVYTHFHNPTFPWTSAGLSSHNWVGLSGMSNLLWSQKPNQDYGTILVGGDYSWPDVRDYYFKAFTEEQKSEREEKMIDYALYSILF